MCFDLERGRGPLGLFALDTLYISGLLTQICVENLSGSQLNRTTHHVTHNDNDDKHLFPMNFFKIMSYIAITEFSGLFSVGK